MSSRNEFIKINRRSLMKGTVLILIGVLISSCYFVAADNIGNQNYPTAYNSGGPSGAYDYLIFTFENATGTYYAAKDSFGRVVDAWTSTNSTELQDTLLATITNGTVALNGVAFDLALMNSIPENVKVACSYQDQYEEFINPLDTTGSPYQIEVGQGVTVDNYIARDSQNRICFTSTVWGTVVNSAIHAQNGSKIVFNGVFNDVAQTNIDLTNTQGITLSGLNPIASQINLATPFNGCLFRANISDSVPRGNWPRLDLTIENLGINAGGNQTENLIWVHHMDGVTVQDNVIRNAYLPIAVGGDDCHIYRNRIINATVNDHGAIFSDNSKGVQIIGNNVTGCAGFGIQFWNDVGAVVADNLVTRCAQGGIFQGPHSDFGSSISKNTLTNNGYGIYIWSMSGSSISTKISENTISNNTLYGINCRVNTNFGIYDLKITNNDILSNAGGGIYFSTTTAGTITGTSLIGNTFAYNTGYAIDTYGESLTLGNSIWVGNTFRGNTNLMSVAFGSSNYTSVANDGLPNYP
jgi:parallel beta-helix repeat protein